MPQKTNLVYLLCDIINLGYFIGAFLIYLGYCYESGKVAWAVGVVKKNPTCILDDSSNSFLIFKWLPTFFI